MRILILFFCLILSWPTWGMAALVSDKTETCLDCHRLVTPGIVADWEKSKHAQITPKEALKKDKLARKISVNKVPEKLANHVIGCAECHTLNTPIHKDTFSHNGFQVHVIVTPRDCATCHAKEASQYGKNKMAHAYQDLMGNPVYKQLVETVIAMPQILEGKLKQSPLGQEAQADACLACHGTIIQVKGFRQKETALGEMTFPILTGWPNQGVGRVNPDGSVGSCASCHTRHNFSIAMARKPYTCAQCHKGPDVPAYKVYSVSPHGAIFKSQAKSWHFNHTPWIIGKDFTAPTCATCHASLLVDENGNVIAQRTHQFNDRLATRIFGIYAHPQPKSPDTSVIRNDQGLPLPVSLTGEPAVKFLISKEEMQKRRQRMKAICQACHSQNWVSGHFHRLEQTIKETNKRTLTATKILLEVWQKGIEKGLPQQSFLFDETIERMWAEQWLFFESSIRYSAAMMGYDYGAFAFGRWYATKNIQQMRDWLRVKENALQKK
jgi:hypothetical protein